MLNLCDGRVGALHALVRSCCHLVGWRGVAEALLHAGPSGSRRGSTATWGPRAEPAWGWRGVAEALLHAGPSGSRRGSTTTWGPRAEPAWGCARTRWWWNLRAQWEWLLRREPHSNAFKLSCAAACDPSAFSTLAMRALYGAQVSWVCSGPTMLVFFKGGSDQAIALNNFAGQNRVPTCIFSEL